MRIAFYRAQKDSWFGTLTNVLSGGGGFSHVELIFSDGMSFGSSSRDGGVRFKNIEFDEGRWAFTNLPVGALDERKCRRYAETLVGRRYDWWGVIRFVLPFAKEHPEDYFCSEIVVETLQQIGYFEGKKAFKISPNKLARMMAVT